MILLDLWQWIDKNIAVIPSKSSASHPIFNPYRDFNSDMDIPLAADARRKNLYNFLKAYPFRPSTLMLGEAIGWRGGRFSGIPFTSEAQIAAKMLPFTGLPTSRRDRPYKERTATVFWDVMYPYFPNFLAWNCIPLHPYQPELPLSNRTPTSKEQSEFMPLLSEFITILAPKNIIAIGLIAQTALLKLGLSHHTVRHPSHGGAGEFAKGVNSIMSQLDRD